MNDWSQVLIGGWLDVVARVVWFRGPTTTTLNETMHAGASDSEWKFEKQSGSRT